ncbi:MAG: hypothetical protein CMM32_05315 [Rhodospirillaceae bacterium]|nr:hypothetical protein [Rhodospirillaceae bacterium]
MGSETHAECTWKGVVGYYDVVVVKAENLSGAWYYLKNQGLSQRCWGLVSLRE